MKNQAAIFNKMSSVIKSTAQDAKSVKIDESIIKEDDQSQAQGANSWTKADREKQKPENARTYRELIWK